MTNTEPNSLRILHMTLKRKWFNLIAFGFKKNEYRAIKDHWLRRLTYSSDMEYDVWEEFVKDIKNPTKNHRSLDELLFYFGVKFKEFDIVRFRNGYGKMSPVMDVEFKKITLTNLSLKTPKHGEAFRDWAIDISLGRVLKIDGQIHLE